MSFAFPAMSLQALASMALHHRELRLLPDILRPHVVATITSTLLERLRPMVFPTDRLSVSGMERRVYRKRKHAAISRSAVVYFQHLGTFSNPES